MQFSTTHARSRNMRAIRAKHCKTTEWRLRALLISSGLRGWKMHVTEVHGNPDFYFQHEHVAVFVDGCFWHGCPTCGHVPKANRPYWGKKLARNVFRDAQIARRLRVRGIHVLRLWECQLRDQPTTCLKRLFRTLDRSARSALRRNTKPDSTL